MKLNQLLKKEKKKRPRAKGMIDSKKEVFQIIGNVSNEFKLIHVSTFTKEKIKPFL